MPHSWGGPRGARAGRARRRADDCDGRRAGDDGVCRSGVRGRPTLRERHVCGVRSALEVPSGIFQAGWGVCADLPCKRGAGRLGLWRHGDRRGCALLAREWDGGGVRRDRERSAKGASVGREKLPAHRRRRQSMGDRADTVARRHAHEPIGHLPMCCDNCVLAAWMMAGHSRRGVRRGLDR